MQGGACRELSAKALREILTRWPDLDEGAINSAAKNYQIRLQHKSATPTNLRKTLDAIVNAASDLHVRLLTLPEEADNSLWDDFSQTQQTEIYEALPQLLTRLQHAAMRGQNAEVGKDGRKRLGPRHQLIAAIAWQLQQAKMHVDKRPMGDLRRITEIVLQDLGESPGDLTATVRDALGQMGGGDRA